MRPKTYCIAVLLSLSFFGCCHHSQPTPQSDTAPILQPSTEVPSTPDVATSPVTNAEDEAIIQTVLANGDELERAISGERAAVFGNNYVGLPAELHGCVSDAKKNVVNLVKVEGFNPKNIRLFTNAQCTKNNYEKLATWVLADIKPGDRRFFATSSHGGETTDENGKIIDVLITWEMVSLGEWTEATQVSPEFWSKLLRSTSGNFVFLNDSCHSGGMMRQAVGSASLKNKRLVRSIDGPPAVQARIDKATERGASWRLAAIAGSVVWACQPSELSEEDSVRGGLGTDAYWTARKKLITTNPKVGDVIREANRILHNELAASQHMGLTGSNKPIFSKD